MQPAISALMDEFPRSSDRIMRLAREDARFAKLANAYHALNREISRGEAARVGAAEIEHLRKMRRIVRSRLEIYISA